jgi:hypothetical protein
MFSRGVWLPSPVFGEKSIGKEEKLSCDGDEDELGGFVFGHEACVEGLHCRIAADGGDGGEIEHLSDDGSSAPDGALAFAGQSGEEVGDKVVKW